MPASLAGLPLEIRLQIARQLDRLKYHSALARCSQDFYRSLNPALYSEDTERLDRWALPWACVNGSVATAAKAIEAGSPADALHQHPPLLHDGKWELMSMLDIAFLGKHAGVVDYLLRNGAELKYVDDSVFMRDADEELMRAFLPYLGEGKWSKRHKLADLALSTGNETLFEMLLSSISDLQDEGFRQWPRLALTGGSLALFQKVTRLGLDASLSDRDKKVAWMGVNLAKSSRAVELAEFVRSHWPSVATSEAFYANEFFASAAGNVELLKWLWEERVKVTGRPQVAKPYDCMDLAIKSKNLETVEFCLGPVTATNSAIFFRACAEGTPEIVRAFIREGADPHYVSEYDGTTALRVAGAAGKNEIIQCLLEYGVQVPENIFFVTQMSYHRCLFPYNLEVAKQLLARGASVVSEYPVPYERPLIIAVCEKAVRDAVDAEVAIGLVQLLLDHGADVNDRVANVFVWQADHRAHPASTGHTCPIREASRGSPKLVQFLIDNGADALAKNAKGYTALHQACQSRNLEVARLLLDIGADPNGTTKPERTTPLIAACTESQPPKTMSRQQTLYNIVQLLLQRGADPNAKTNKGITPLHLLASGHCLDLGCFDLLLEYGADINAKDKVGATPLHVACQRQDAVLVRALLVAGADVNGKDDLGRTGLQCASLSLDRERHTAAVVDALLSFGAEVSQASAASFWMGKNRGILGMRDVLRKHGIPETDFPSPITRTVKEERESNG